MVERSSLASLLLLLLVGQPGLALLSRFDRLPNRLRLATAAPSLKYFTTLIRDELKLKFRGTRILTKVKSDSDKTSLNWFRIEMGWSTGIHSGHP